MSQQPPEFGPPPQYGAPPPQFGPPTQYGPPPQYGAPPPQFGPPTQYGPPPQPGPAPQYGGPPPQYGPPPPQYGASPSPYGPPPQPGTRQPITRRFEGLSAWQVILSVGPVGLAFVGGAIGGALGGTCMVANVKVARTRLSTPVKALAMLGVDLATFVVFLSVEYALRDW